MIAKRIRRRHRRARGTVAQLARAVGALSTYIVDANPERLRARGGVMNLSRYLADIHGLGEDRQFASGEKVAALGVRNLRSYDLAGWQDEMLAMAARCPRAHDPLEHYVLSWREGEHPSDHQAEEAVGILLDLLGAANCPALWSVHDNTEHRHAHVMLVRVDPASGRTITLGDGWDIDRLHQAVALIEERQGWRAEQGAMYEARDGVIRDRRSGAVVRDASGRQMSRSRRARVADSSVSVYLLTAIRQDVERATSWLDLHKRLAARGVHYRRVGSGARIYVGEESHKPSSLYPTWSRAALEKRLGPFEPYRAMGGAYEDYAAAASVELGRIRAAHADARRQLRAARARALATLAGHPHAAMLRMAVTAEFAGALTALDSAFLQTKAHFVAGRMSLPQWRAGGQPAIPTAAPLPALVFPMMLTAGERKVLLIRGFVPHRKSWQTDYVGEEGRLSWSDHRVAVIVHHVDYRTVEAAMLLAAARWGAIQLRGSPAFLAMGARVAMEHGLDAVDQADRHLAPLGARRSSPKMEGDASRASMPPIGREEAPSARAAGRSAAESSDESSAAASAWWLTRGKPGAAR